MTPCHNSSFLYLLSKSQISMSTSYIPPLKTIHPEWYVVDATDKRLGRLASEIAMVLRGKNKPEYTPHLDTGDFVIVVNVEKLQLQAKSAPKKSIIAIPVVRVG